VKEPLLEDVSTQGLLASRCGCEITAVSGSSDSEKSDLGGEGPASGSGTATLSKGLRVRRIGPLLWNVPPVVSEPSFVFFGSERAQFSQGMALFLSFSS
jgi:hypothetical protein